MSASPWTPFRYRAFAVLWSAMVISNIGTWMNSVGAGWLMATLDPDPLMVALVQAATTTPIFLLALTAGAVADIVDRRRLLLVVNGLMALVATAMALLVTSGQMTALRLLVSIFLLGCGMAFIAPAWQAIVPQLVPKEALSRAITLHSLGINISRAVGPAVAGVLIVTLGMAAPFAINAASFLAIVAGLLWWRPPTQLTSRLPPEGIFEALRNGLSYVRYSTPVRATLIRAVAIFLFASAYWALLPVIAKTWLGGGARLYGILLGSVGVGAVLGALLLPRIKRQLGADVTVAVGTAGTALVLAAFSLIADPYAAVAASLVAGICWIFVVSSLLVSAQTALPNWVRARGLSVFLTLFFGSMAIGSVIWGKTASELGIDTALLIAAGGALITIPLTWHARLGQGEELDLTPSLHWPDPMVLTEATEERGPVMTIIEYRIAHEDVPQFLTLMREMARARRRSGAVQWGVMEDAADPDLYLEYFIERTWLAHLRHHERVAGTDRAIQERVHRLHRGSAPPSVRHLLAPRGGR
ncbi:arabinose efflux permease family protein [Thioflavicoccus mobilis 8321]|uniref:Arabinose efflux permease family protein n=2 Tax=Thioflavicoccus mobilis TaxID=80679 RepID=L0H2Z5_9GAMM|nr:arabinose efflux permease family protein [Thioflavicoccus mobilis 8321]